MTEAEAIKLKAKLDLDLQSAADSTKVAFGEVSFFLFLTKGWVKYKEFQRIDPPQLTWEATVYGEFNAICDPRIPADEAVVR